MKKTISILLVFVMAISLCACGTGINPVTETKISPDERLEDAVKEYVSINTRVTIDDAVSEPVSVSVIDTTKTSDNKWLVLGTSTIKINGQIMSAQFFLEVTYDETTDAFDFTINTFDKYS